MLPTMRVIATICSLSASLITYAQGPAVDVKDAWIRGTVAGQKATGAYMDITSKVPARLVSVATPAAGMVQIHKMKMEGGVMKMFPVDAVELPANHMVKLAPGGFHLMLMALKHPLKAGDRVPLNLTFELKGGKRETVGLQVEVRALTGEMRHGH